MLVLTKTGIGTIHATTRDAFGRDRSWWEFPPRNPMLPINEEYREVLRLCLAAKPFEIQRARALAESLASDFDRDVEMARRICALESELGGRFVRLSDVPEYAEADRSMLEWSKRSGAGGDAADRKRRDALARRNFISARFEIYQSAVLSYYGQRLLDGGVV